VEIRALYNRWFLRDVACCSCTTSQTTALFPCADTNSQRPTLETIMQVSSYIGSPVTVSQISKKMLCWEDEPHHGTKHTSSGIQGLYFWCLSATEISTEHILTFIVDFQNITCILRLQRVTKFSWMCDTHW